MLHNANIVLRDLFGVQLRRFAFERVFAMRYVTSPSRIVTHCGGTYTSKNGKHVVTKYIWPKLSEWKMSPTQTVVNQSS